MKVWIVVGDMDSTNYTARNVLGVFATLRAAQAFQQELFKWQSYMSGHSTDEPDLPPEVWDTLRWWDGYSEIVERKVQG